MIVIGSRVLYGKEKLKATVVANSAERDHFGIRFLTGVIMVADVNDLEEFDWDEDKINHPSHYTSHPSGVECITVTEWMGFNLGNAVKYIWRADLKSDNPIEDLQKAKWYIEREIARREK